jgi:uncharacterized protein (UPF0210 family)
MPRNVECWLLLVIALFLAAVVEGQESHYSKPKVRTITAFVRIDRDSYSRKIAEALSVLREAQKEFEDLGYGVETIRLVTQPLGQLVEGQSDNEALAFLKTLSDVAERERFALNVGPAMLSDADDPRIMHLLAHALAKIPGVNASAIIAGDDGIHWKVIRESASLVRYVAGHSSGGQGEFNFAATAMLKPLGPFFPGAYHTGPGRQFSIGFESANVVQEVFALTRRNADAAEAELTKQLTIHAQVAQAVGNRVSKLKGWDYAGMDPTPAPHAAVPIGSAFETYTGAKFGASGTLTAALIITTAVKAVAVKQIGFSGLMMPVMEDSVLARRWSEGTFDMDSLLAYSAVCGTGLDTIPLPGTVTEEQLTRIFGDVAALAWKWHKPLAARLLPAHRRRAGEMTQFTNQWLVNTTVRAIH